MEKTQETDLMKYHHLKTWCAKIDRSLFFIILYLRNWQTLACWFSRKLIRKELGFLGPAAAQRGQSCQAAGPAPLENPTTIVIAGLAQAVVEYQPRKDYNLDLSPNPLLSLVLLREACETKLSVALSCWLLAVGRRSNSLPHIAQFCFFWGQTMATLQLLIILSLITLHLLCVYLSWQPWSIWRIHQHHRSLSISGGKA